VGDHRQLKQQAGALLAELGRDPDEVAATLEAAGVRGDPRSNLSCAVALYLNASMGSDPRIRSVAVGPCTVLLDMAAPPGRRPAGKLQVQLPKAVRRFVAAFDARQYPEVTRPPAAGADSPAPPTAPEPQPVAPPA
jgi:hypothetical protein